MSRNSATTAAAVKLGIFSLVSLLVTGVLALVMGNFGLGSQKEFAAVFASASMLVPGDDVRVAGIPVGEVKDVRIYHRTQALVTFKVKSDVPLTTASHAEVRYLNIVGDRYLAITQGTPSAPLLEAGATIPITQTSPALNLTELYAGFQPLFAALNPHDVNQLAMNIISVLQGEGGTVQGLLAETASLTNSLADRDQLIGQVITNLTGMLNTVNDKRQQLTQLVVQMEQWMGNLAGDRRAIGSSIQNMSTLTAQVADLLTRSRPLLKTDVVQLRKLATELAKPSSQALLKELLHRLPTSMANETRIGTYGSWYNYYLCDYEGSIKLPDTLGPLGRALQRQLNDVSFHSTAPRCAR